MTTGFSKENCFSLARLNESNIPARPEDSRWNARKSSARSQIQHRNLAIRRRKMNGEEERLAIMTNHHIRTRLNRGEVHPLIPVDKSSVVLIELRDL
jgi:hypothetical protein